MSTMGTNLQQISVQSRGSQSLLSALKLQKMKISTGSNRPLTLSSKSLAFYSEIFILLGYLFLKKTTHLKRLRVDDYFQQYAQAFKF